jgi:hypothetical protein
VSSGTGGDAEAGAGAAGAGDVGGTGGGGVGGIGGIGGVGGAACVPKPEICDGVSNDCNDAIDEGGVCPRGCSARTRDGHVYVLCVFPDAAQELDYDHATTWCSNAGPTLKLGPLALARIETADENDFVKAWIAEQATVSGMIWFGANDIDQEGRWVWGRGADAVQFFVGSSQGGGTPYMGAFDDFADGRPNSANGDEDCGAFDSDFAWQWNDLVCSEPRLGFICEQTP